MNHLAAQQQALLDALFAWPAQDAMKNIAVCAIDTGTRGLKAYQTNGHMLAERVLHATYPVLAQMLGLESMADLARALWHAHPPNCGDMALWGSDLPDFVGRSGQLVDVPYLSDVAAAEWALHRCASAADASPDPASLALLAQYDPLEMQLRLAPGCAVVRSAWPVASILSAHLQQTPSLEAVGHLVRQGAAQDVVVWREQLAPRVRLAQAGESVLLSALLAGQSLGEAIDASPELDFGTWFPAAVQSALVLGVQLKRKSTNPS